ncbi:MAG TPA: FUSC family protein [Solirubrobacteraceae bacterium]|nr:FUSC family protein [Solirubrobacteraceae bacterium]
MHPLRWLGGRDRDLAALRRSARAAIVMPAMFALGDKVIQNPAIATFAAFGSFAMLLLVDFPGPLRERLQAQALLGLAGLALVSLGTLVCRSVWLSTLAMAAVGFVVIFSGVISSVVASATFSLLLSFILPVTLKGPLSSLPDRLEGWAMASGAALIAVAVLWPTPRRGPLREAATRVCRALAARLHADAAYLLSGRDEALARDHEHAVEQAQDALAAMHHAFLATPYRPASLSTSGRTILRLVDELGWLGAIVGQAAPRPGSMPVNRPACAVKVAAAGVLDRAAELLAGEGGDCAALHAALDELGGALGEMERGATVRPGEIADGSVGEASLPAPEQVVSALDPSFRALELGFAVTNIARNVDLAAAAERRTWAQRLLGREPAGLAGQLQVAQRRATAHIDRGSVWLHNSVRGAVGLALAVLVANETGVQHSFWVVLGTLSVLRSNALNTGQNILRGLAGTVAGFVVAGGLVELIGTDTTVLWFLLPVAVLLAGIAPAAISFAAGQAAFTLTLVFLYNIIQPAGWKVGLLRVEDIAIGCAVSLLVGLLFWPRGARAALRRALADAYRESAAYLAGAVDYGVRRCDAGAEAIAAPEAEALRAGAAARRLDDTFRTYLSERGAKPVPLSEVATLLSGAGGLRIAADAVLDLWRREDGASHGDRATARAELLKASAAVEGWYDDLAQSFVERSVPREPLERDAAADGRLVEAVRHDLRAESGESTATAVRMIWTGDHLDAARRLQRIVFEPARSAVAGG